MSFHGVRRSGSGRSPTCCPCDAAWAGARVGGTPLCAAHGRRSGFSLTPGVQGRPGRQPSGP
eukprot:4580727-Alexandrium_andersonii.AAC.1